MMKGLKVTVAVIIGISVSKISDKWNVNMVDSILRNEMYIGNLIQGKRTRISHKTHNIII